MTSEGKDTRTLSKLARDLVEGRHSVSPNLLLLKADEFLILNIDGDTDSYSAVRAVAYRLL